ncbi:single-stranded DNA-binding protein [Actinomyces sp. B33]|uniref:single-stranded DNA-binding protein n=1 Tax=Actinomyces sp. B33 TaxID=2942131 RepID=UPI002342274F|nr:single-stranded DNA-binding protein [Actinomyces sp. B33]MDC4232907.1 single-stranded DNA-binding protein [Actinomyces sp. B33]
MMNETTMTLRGRVGTDLRTFTTSGGHIHARFRLAVSRWRVNDAGALADERTTWYTIRVWDSLAENVLRSVRKGEPVIVVGRPGTNAYIDKNGEARGELIITAQSVGHDLARGVGSFSKPQVPGSARTPDDDRLLNAESHEGDEPEAAPVGRPAPSNDHPIAQDPDRFCATAATIPADQGGGGCGEPNDGEEEGAGLGGTRVLEACA